MADDGVVSPDVAADERTTLEQFLDSYRAEIVRQVRGLDDARAFAHPLASTDLTVGGIIKHLALVEDLWFTYRFLGAGLPDPWASAPLSEDHDWEFRRQPTDTLDGVVALYSSACDRSRATAARFASLDATAAKGTVSLRWLFTHMIEETARHVGHLDLLLDPLGPR